MAPVIKLKQFAETENVGDRFSSLVVRHLMGAPLEVIGEGAINQPNLVGVGSIAHWADSSSVVWGAGLISTTVQPQAQPSVFAALRGPRTVRRLRELGFEVPSAIVIGDPGVFAPEIVAGSAQRDIEIGLVPHYVDRDEPFVAAAEAAGVVVLDVRWPVEQFLNTISRCRRVVSSSLHGIVFAHAYGVPAGWITLSDRVHGSGFKFRDYLESVGLDESDAVVTSRMSWAQTLDVCCLPRRPIDTEALRAALHSTLGYLCHDAR